MDDPNDQKPQQPNSSPDDPANLGMPAPADVPVEEEASEEELHPRRAASAEFVVSSDVASDVALREAMNPANKSLADALRLSYRVLQLVLIVLVVLFLASGSRTVGENESGILTRWGRIVEVNGQEALEPGLHLDWPYPVGEFIVFEIQNQTVDLGNAFFPGIPAGMTMDQATQSALESSPLVPGRDGSLITRDGDLAHLRVSAKYEIAEPAQFARSLPAQNPAAIDEIVKMAMEHATVHVAATMSLQQITDSTDEVKYQIQTAAQDFLNEIGSGIRISNMNVPVAIPPLPIRRAFAESQNARVFADSQITNARSRAREVLIGAGGSTWESLLTLMNEYEDAIALGEQAEAEALLAQLTRAFDENVTTGEAASIIAEARNYSAEIESTLGNEARRFASLLPQFRKHPQLVVNELWMQAYQRTISHPLAEVFYVPQSDSPIAFSISGIQEIARQRRESRLTGESRREAARGGRGAASSIPTGEQMGREDRAGRQLRVENGVIRGMADDKDDEN